MSPPKIESQTNGNNVSRRKLVLTGNAAGRDTDDTMEGDEGFDHSRDGTDGSQTTQGGFATPFTSTEIATSLDVVVMSSSGTTITSTAAEQPLRPELPTQQVMAEALRLASGRKVLRVPGGFPPPRRRSSAGGVRVATATGTASTTTETPMPMDAGHNPHRHRRLSQRQRHQQDQRKRAANRVVSSAFSVTDSEDSAEGEVVAQMTSKSEAWPLLQVAEQDFTSDATAGTLQPLEQKHQRQKQKLTDADMREAIDLLMEKRRGDEQKLVNLRQRRQTMAQREIEMGSGGRWGSGDGPFRLTVCVPRNAGNNATNSSTASEELAAGKTRRIRPHPLPAEIMGNCGGALLPGVELWRDSSSAAAAAAAAAAASLAITLPPPKNLRVATTVRESLRCSLAPDLIGGLHKKLELEWSRSEQKQQQQQEQLASSASGPVRDAEPGDSATSDLAANTQQPKEQQDVPPFDEAKSGSFYDEYEADQEQEEGPLETDMFSEADSDDAKHMGRYCAGPSLAESTTWVAAAQVEAEEARKVELGLKMAAERRQELRQRLLQTRVPLQSCPARVRGHTSGRHERQVGLTKCLLTRLGAKARRSRPDIARLCEKLRLTRPLRLNQFRRSSSDNGMPLSEG